MPITKFCVRSIGTQRLNVLAEAIARNRHATWMAGTAIGLSMQSTSLFILDEPCTAEVSIMPKNEPFVLLCNIVI